MTDIQGPNVTPGTGHSYPMGSADVRMAKRAAATGETPPGGTPVAGEDFRRSAVAGIGARAAAIQQAAMAASRAIETLAEMERTIVFALDAAGEAAMARTLPSDALRVLQCQVDLAINSVDCLASNAACSGAALFDGRFVVEAGAEMLRLPEVSSRSLGGATRAEVSHWGDSVEYSQSIASAASGGPNSLSFFAAGAAQALAVGLARVRDLKAALEEFRESKVMAAAANMAVILANVLASSPAGDNLDQVMTLLADVRHSLRSASTTVAAPRPGAGILRLLE